jgi:predicted nucleic acid-binding Zn ribbon protein
MTLPITGVGKSDRARVRRYRCQAMPTYVYKFLETGETIEVQQSFDDAALTEATHPVTGSPMPVKKVYLPVGVTFRGDGFYKTDNRSSKQSGSSGSDSKSDTKSDSKSDAGSSSKSDAGSSSKSDAGSSGTSSSPSAPAAATKSD